MSKSRKKDQPETLSGRPPIEPGKPRLAKVTLRLHPEEIAALKKHAKRAGMPFTRFAVSVLQGAGMLTRPESRGTEGSDAPGQ